MSGPRRWSSSWSKFVDTDFCPAAGGQTLCFRSFNLIGWTIRNRVSKILKKENHCRRRVSSRFNWRPRRRCKWCNFCSSWWIWFLSSSGSFLNFQLTDWLVAPSVRHQFKSLSQQACANQGARIYAPETKLQRTATMAWYQQFIAVSRTLGLGSARSELDHEFLPWSSPVPAVNLRWDFKWLIFLVLGWASCNQCSLGRWIW